MPYGIFESTNIKGKNLSFVSDIDLENGMLVHRGDLVEGSKDIYKAVIPTAATMADTPVYVVGNPVLTTDTSSAVNYNEDMYINKAGKVFRVYPLDAKGTPDKFAIASYSIDGGDASVNSYVGLQDGTGRPIVSATAPTGSAFVGKITRVKDIGYNFYLGKTVDTRINKVTIEVVRNG